MRRLLAAAVALTVAGAVSPGEPAPESRAYVGFSFGGAQIVPRDFHYGLRLDHDSRFVDGRVPPLLQVDFTRLGFNDARINGMDLVRRAPRLRQAEEPAPTEAPVEPPAEPGVAEDTAAGEVTQDGMFSDYTAADWALLAVGVLGVGFAANEVTGGEPGKPPAS